MFDGFCTLCLAVESTTASRDGFTFDYTGHLLHVARDETADYLEGRYG